MSDTLIVASRARDEGLTFRAQEYDACGERWAFVSVVWPASDPDKKRGPHRVLIEEAHTMDEAATALLARWDA